MSTDPMTFTQHGPSMKLIGNSKQPAGNSLALNTAGTEPAGRNQRVKKEEAYSVVCLKGLRVMCNCDCVILFFAIRDTEDGIKAKCS